MKIRLLMVNLSKKINRLLTKSDAVLRIEGESKEADQDVVIAKELGLKVYYNLKEITNVE